MIKELEALKRLYENVNHTVVYYHSGNVHYDYLTIETALKVLQIIKETRADINLLKKSTDYDDYCGCEAAKLLSTIEPPTQKGITEEEYKLLKGYFKC